ncbi:FUSC family protein [uncultured Brachyspira sp.]|uniref:FUSC family protein n=1 Tax=uncultured Brachyspira sp. TaxID=221953 RepID=UPI002613653B|nr:FUSC family protein [uncultured Brachyspira sp.]
MLIFYKKQINIIKAFLIRALDFIPSVLTGMFVLVISNNLFGRENSTIGIITIFICAFMRQSFTVSSFPAVAFRILLLGFLATIAEQNIVFIILFNFIVPFCVVFLLSDDFVPRNYFIYGFTYVLLQAYNIPISNIHLRMEAILTALLVSFIFLVLNKFLTKHKVSNNLASSSIKIISKKLLSLYNKSCSLDKGKNDELFSIINSYTSAIYVDSLKRHGIMNNRNINHFELVLFLEEINQLIKKEYEKMCILNDDDLNYFLQLSKLMDRISNLLKHDISKKEKEFNSVISGIKYFYDNYSLSDEKSNYEWIYAVRKLNRILYRMFENKKDDFEIKRVFNLKFIRLKKEFNINKCHFRFALKMGIIMCISFTIRYFLPDEIAVRGYWLPILSYIMIYPFYEEQKANLKIDVFGNFLGALIFAAVFKYVPNEMIIPSIGVCFVLSLSSVNGFFKKIYGTVSALISSFPYMTKLVSTSSRVGFILIALSMVWIFDHFIIRTESHKGMVDKISELIEIDTIIINQIRKAINNEETSVYLYEIILKAYMIKNNIIIHEKNQTRYKGTPITDSLIESNDKFILEAEQIISLIKSYNREEDKQNMLIFIENITNILGNTAKLFRNEIDDFNNNEENKINTIKDDSYIFYRLENCFNSINSINSSIKNNIDNIF